MSIASMNPAHTYTCIKIIMHQPLYLTEMFASFKFVDICASNEILALFAYATAQEEHAHLQSFIFIVRGPVIGLIKWLRPKGLKVCSYVEKCAEFKSQTLKKMAGTQKCYA